MWLQLFELKAASDQHGPGSSRRLGQDQQSAELSLAFLHLHTPEPCKREPQMLPSTLTPSTLCALKQKVTPKISWKKWNENLSLFWCPQKVLKPMERFFHYYINFSGTFWRPPPPNALIYMAKSSAERIHHMAKYTQPAVASLCGFTGGAALSAPCRITVT